MAYEVGPDITDAEEHLAERLNEYLIDIQGINTDDFTVVAEGNGSLELRLDTETDEIWDQIQQNSNYMVVTQEKED